MWECQALKGTFFALSKEYTEMKLISLLSVVAVDFEGYIRIFQVSFLDHTLDAS